MQQDDPAERTRGEFMQVQIALEDEDQPPDVRKELQARERALLDGHQREWLGALAPLARLRVLQINHGNQVHRLQVLADNPAMAGLTHLLIHPHNANAWHWNAGRDELAGYTQDGGYLPLSVVRPLLHSATLGRLSHLRLRCSTLGDEGCREIVQSGILQRLQYLDLRHGCITDEGAWILADCTDLLNLQWLDVERNALTRYGIQALRRLNIPGRYDDQQTTDEVDEQQFLREGEFE